MKTVLACAEAQRPRITILLPSCLVAGAAFLAGRWTAGPTVVKADSGGSPVIQIQPIRGNSGLTVFYPDLNKLFVYQTPFAGAPTWGCSYSIN